MLQSLKLETDPVAMLSTVRGSNDALPAPAESSTAGSYTKHTNNQPGEIESQFPVAYPYAPPMDTKFIHSRLFRQLTKAKGRDVFENQ